MKLKKIMSTVLAGAMTLSMAVTAFAADTDLQQSTEVTGETKTPTISISVPATGKVILNPYKMSVDVSADQDGSDLKTDQIISAVSYIKNKTDVALNVSATATGKIESTSTVKPVFATATTQGAKAPTTKSVYMYLEVIDAGAGDDADATAPTTAPTDSSWKAYAAANTNQILIGAKAVTKTNMVTTNAVADGASNFIAYRLAGDAASAPTEAWASTDKVGVTIAFTFQPTVKAAG